jgi:hypothetical protein
MGRHRSARVGTQLRAGFVLVALVGLAACGGGESPHAAVRGAGTARRTVTTSTPSPSPSPSPTTTATIDTAPPATTAPVATTTAPPTTVPPAPEPPLPVETSLADRLVGVGDAGQVIAVVAGGYGQTSATFTAYERGDTG